MTNGRPRPLLCLASALLSVVLLRCHGNMSTPYRGFEREPADQGLPPGWVCGPTTCPDGCCRDNKCLAGTSSEACGKGGELCLSCAAGSVCSAEGVCSCDPSTCVGCCSAEGCQPGNSSSACGANGAACQSCGPDDQCANGSCAGHCQGCTTGCCAGGSCEPGTADDACGRNGETCKRCGTGARCDTASGTCVAKPCDPSWCKTGCCDGKAPSQCVAPPTNAACGLNGDACKDCGAGRFCDVTTCACQSPTSQ